MNLRRLRAIPSFIPNTCLEGIISLAEGLFGPSLPPLKRTFTGSKVSADVTRC